MNTKKQYKYEIGDLVELASEWDNQLGLILDIDETDFDIPIYLMLINGQPSAGWLTSYAIKTKVI